MKRIPVIIDCDPGHDDMVALVLAVGSGKLDVRAVTTVAGNNTIENTTQNALNVLHYIGADAVPVAMGAQDGIVRSHKETMERMTAYDLFAHKTDSGSSLDTNIDYRTIFRKKYLTLTQRYGL